MFRSNVFDPKLIVAQIVTTQALFYVCMGVFFFLVDLSVGQPPLIPEQLFLASHVTFHTAFDVIVICGYVFASIVGYYIHCADKTSAWILAFVVERHRKILDFAATIYTFHFVGVLTVDPFGS